MATLMCYVRVCNIWTLHVRLSYNMYEPCTPVHKIEKEVTIKKTTKKHIFLMNGVPRWCAIAHPPVANLDPNDPCFDPT